MCKDQQNSEISTAPEGTLRLVKEFLRIPCGYHREFAIRQVKAVANSCRAVREAKDGPEV